MGTRFEAGGQGVFTVLSDLACFFLKHPIIAFETMCRAIASTRPWLSACVKIRDESILKGFQLLLQFFVHFYLFGFFLHLTCFS